MSSCLKMRRAARQVGRLVADSIHCDNDWEQIQVVGADTALSRGLFVVAIQARRFRVLDRVKLYHGLCEVWLPVLTRLKLRKAVRYRTARLARATWQAVYERK
jgi:hypothetical protein